MVTLVTSALPADVSIDRLVLVAPAISPDYPVASAVLPHVREFVVNYASERDLQVGWGTRTFGTIDRKNTASAGAIGFAVEDERLLQYHWSAADVPFGHAGNHLAYLNGALAGSEVAAGARSCASDPRLCGASGRIPVRSPDMTMVILALLGGVVGGALLSDFGGVVFGLVVGALVGSVADLAGRVRTLERRLDGAKSRGHARAGRGDARTRCRGGTARAGTSAGARPLRPSSRRLWISARF